MNSISQNPTDGKNEIWKDVPGYEGSYKVSNLGRVKSIDRITRHGRRVNGRMLKQKTNCRSGYMEVTLHMHDRGSVFRVHRIVMLAFVGKRPPKHDIHHIDNDKTNNALINLVYMSNKKHQTTIKRRKGVNNPNSVLNPQKVTRIRSLYASGLSQREIAKIMRINQGTVHQVTSRKTWKHIE